MKLLVFDGNSVVNRAFYAIRDLSTRSGMPTNALYGFLKLYFKYFEMSSPDMVAVAFDRREPTFRHKIYSEYKAQRKGMPEELAAQIRPLKDILDAMNVTRFECAGYEADDIIGTLSAWCEKNGYECDIVSGDRDDFQLVSALTRVIMPVTRGGMSEVEIYGEPQVREKYGIAPLSVIDLKAIMGDASDNIKGVAGIGEKGALSLIQTYGTLENVYDNLDNVKPALASKLTADRDSAFLSKTLATIVRDAPIDLDTDMSVKPFGDGLFPLLERYELQSLVKQMELKAPEAVSVTALPAAPAAKYEAFFRDGGLYFVRDGECTLALTPDGVCEVTDIEPLLTDDTVEKFTFKPKDVYKKLLESVRDVKPFYDAEVAQYVIDPAGSYTPESLCRAYCEPADGDLAAALCSMLPRIVAAQRKIIGERDQHALLFDIEFPLTVVLADMENRGFSVDTGALSKYSEKLSAEIAVLEQRIFFLAGGSFNINSPKQLGAVLFEDLGLPHGKKTKSGWSTNADVLEKLRGRHEIVDSILEYRKYVKLKSTYCDGLLKLVGSDGKIHTSFNQTVTQTGRISSTEPNLQNIPVRTELGRELRAMFAAGEGNILLDADYSQIELRVLAHVANDKNMLDAFARDEDVHTVTAARVFGVTPDFVTPAMRRAAKAVNFGIVYGISDFSLAQDIGTTRAEAKRYIDSYLTLYSGVREFMTHVVEQAKKDGYVTTLLGRRRYLPELSSSNFNIRSFGERAAMNAPIQGTAADIIKIAMVNTRRALLEAGLSAKLILQVHDELIIEAPESEREAAGEILSREMENAMKLNVRLKAEVTYGRTWYECK